MQPISFKRHRFPPDAIRYAVWLYFRFTLSIRDVEELLAERGIEVSREAVRTWGIKFGPLFAKNLRRRQRPTGRWHLDEMVVKVGGRKRWLWRAVDDEGLVLDMLIQGRRNKKAALRLLRKILKKTAVQPEAIRDRRDRVGRRAPAEHGRARRDSGGLHPDTHRAPYAAPAATLETEARKRRSCNTLSSEARLGEPILSEGMAMMATPIRRGQSLESARIELACPSP